MEKGTRVEQIHRATILLREAGIQVGFFLQFGYPGESRQDIEKTLEMVRKCQPVDIGMSVAYPLPGTKFYSAVGEQLGVQQNWYDSDDLAMLYRGPFTTAFYRQLHTTLHCEFRANKAWRSLHSKKMPDGYFWKSLVRRIYYCLRLPVERWKLERLSHQQNQGVEAIAPRLSQSEAATPTPQME
jgi:anaerobic magnesium-protoporphyrin IX monomethyl ester cyclase